MNLTRERIRQVEVKGLAVTATATTTPRPRPSRPTRTERACRKAPIPSDPRPTRLALPLVAFRHFGGRPRFVGSEARRRDARAGRGWHRDGLTSAATPRLEHVASRARDLSPVPRTLSISRPRPRPDTSDLSPVPVPGTSVLSPVPVPVPVPGHFRFLARARARTLPLSRPCPCPCPCPCPRPRPDTSDFSPVPVPVPVPGHIRFRARARPARNLVTTCTAKTPSNESLRLLVSVRC
jgi:hypothetical protein